MVDWPTIPVLESASLANQPAAFDHAASSPQTPTPMTSNNTTDSDSLPSTTAQTETDTQTANADPAEADITTELIQRDDQLADLLTQFQQHITGLETELEHRDERIEQLETQLEDATEELDQLEEHIEDLETTLEKTTTTTDARLDAHEKKLNANKDRVCELQARELEKGAHLRADHVDPDDVEVDGGKLERITKADDRAYFRLPEHADPLARGGDVSLSYGDLLPIQQLARMDDDMLRSTANTLPTRLSAKLWKARADSSVGDNPWKPGGSEVREYVTASDLKHWIRRQEPGISEAYAKKLVSRMIDPLLDLSKNRLAIRKRTERKNGLEYTERRIVLPADVDIPGKTVSSADQ